MEQYDIFLYSSLAVFVTDIFAVVLILNRKTKRHRTFTAFNSVLVCTFVSIYLLIYPTWVNELHSEANGEIIALFASLQSTLQVFFINAGFDTISNALTGQQGGVAFAYRLFGALLFVLAPILTFGLILSFIRNVSAYGKYIMGFFKEAYIFSELNEHSVALAESERKNHGRRIIIAFAHVLPEAVSSELEKRAKQINAIMFMGDIAALQFAWHSKTKSSDLSFFAISEEERNNIHTALKLNDKYGERRKANLYVFSSTKTSELLLSDVIKSSKLKIRRVDALRSLAYHTLYEYGTRLYDNAKQDNGKKRISVLIIGLGRFGTEILKAVTWYGQMDGYSLEVNAFDAEPHIRKQLQAQMPELLDDTHNGTSSRPIAGEAEYDISIFGGIDAKSIEFANSIKAIKKTTAVFVAFGNDTNNIETAVHIRTLFEQISEKPEIYAVVEDYLLANRLTAWNRTYNVTLIGDLESLYSAETVLPSELEMKALQRHLAWGDEASFWSNEYNYRSSIASEIHKRLREHLDKPINKEQADALPDKEHYITRLTEHKRWNAYVRSEGYIWSGSVEKASRNNLGKTHNLLVPFDALPEDEKQKDDY
jgi:hypothetical protein